MAFLLVESNCICLFKRHGHLLSFYYHCLCHLTGCSAPLFFFFIPFLLILKACDLASDWSLVVDPCIFSLVTCMVAYRTMWGSFLFHVSQVAIQVTGRLRLVPMHLYWSLAWSLMSALLYMPYCVSSFLSAKGAILQVTGHLS